MKVLRIQIRLILGSWIRIRIRIKLEGWIGNRIKLKSMIRIRNKEEALEGHSGALVGSNLEES